jgi:hypothetical protein
MRRLNSLELALVHDLDEWRLWRPALPPEVAG